MADGEAYSEVSVSLALALQRLDAQAQLRIDQDDYWSVRGVPIDVRAMAKAAAQDRGVSLSDWLTDAVIRHARVQEPARDLSQETIWADVCDGVGDLELEETHAPIDAAPVQAEEQVAELTEANDDVLFDPPVGLSPEPTDELAAIFASIQSIVAEAQESLAEDGAKSPVLEQDPGLSEISPISAEVEVDDEPTQTWLAAPDADFGPIWTPPIACEDAAPPSEVVAVIEPAETWIAPQPAEPRRGGLLGLFWR